MRDRRRRLMSQINVVPYIDVTLVLLIIFMITAPLLTRGVKVNLPEAPAKPLSAKELEQHPPVVLTVDEKGQLFLSIGAHPDRAIEAKRVVALVSVVLQRVPETQILVKGDRGANYADVLRGMTLLQLAGAKSIGLITKPPPKSLAGKAQP